MTRRLLAALALGALSSLTAVHLTSGADPSRDERLDDRDRRLFVAAERARTAAGPATAMLVAVRGDCPPSRSLVRVLRRIHDARLALPDVVIYTDTAWPELEQLAAATGRVSVRIDTTLARRVSSTPAAVSARGLRVGEAPTHGLPQVVRLVRDTHDPTPRQERQHDRAR